MSALTIDSSRFGTIEIPSERVIEFPHGLIGLGGRRYAIVTRDGGSFAWLHSVEDAALALPVTNPWGFFADYAVDLSDEESARLGISDPAAVDVWVTVRAGATPADFSANLRAPILVAHGRGHQVINEAPHAPVRAPLFPETSPAEQAA
jgi:flagellar assembly factor FliW